MARRSIVNKTEQPLFKARIGGTGFGKSIFPLFNVNVPMPRDTPVPPEVIVVRRPDAEAAGGSATKAPGTSIGQKHD